MREKRAAESELERVRIVISVSDKRDLDKYGLTCPHKQMF